MKARAGLLLLLPATLAACTTTRAPDMPVPAGDGYVWVLRDGGRSALWGPPASEAVFTVTCDAARGRVEFHHYGLAEPEGVTGLRIEAGDQAGTYPAQLQRIALGDYLLATTSSRDPFLRHLRETDRWRVHAGGQTLRIAAGVAPPQTVLRACTE